MDFLIRKSFIRQQNTSVMNYHKRQSYQNPFLFTGINSAKKGEPPSELSRQNSSHSTEIPLQNLRHTK